MHIKSAHNRSKEKNMEPDIDPKLEKYCKPEKYSMFGYNPEYPLSNEDFIKIIDGKVPKQCSKCSRYFSKMIYLIEHWKQEQGCKINFGQSQTINTGEIQWQESFPVDMDTWDRMKKGEIEKVCPRCKKIWASKKMRSIFLHFLRNDCFWQEEKLEDVPEMSISYTDEESGQMKFVCAFINCPDYGRTWPSKQAVQEHWQVKHKESVKTTISCGHCPERFVISWLYRAHIRQKHPETLGLTFTCSICGKSCKNAYKLKDHEKTHQSKSVICDYCDFKTNSNTNKNKHMQIMHPDKLGVDRVLYKCQHCLKEFKWPHSFKQHMEVAHTDYKPDPKFKCSICSKQLKQGNSFDKHMMNSHGVGERCEICNKLYKTKEVLEQHKKAVHED